MAIKRHFTDARVRDWIKDFAAGPGTGRTEYQDDQQPKLHARVSRKGATFSALTWSRHEGKLKRINLGTHETLTIRDARIECVKALAALDNGKDPTAERKASRAAFERSRLSPAAMADAYIADCERKGKALRPKTIASYRKALPNLLGEYFFLSIEKLDPATLERLVEKRSKRTVTLNAYGTNVVTGSPDEARKGIKCLARLCRLNHIVPPTERLPEGTVPATNARPGKLGTVEAQALMAWLHAQHGRLDAMSVTAQHCRMMMLALVTGWRFATLSSLRWEYFDFDRSIVRIPGEAQKNKLAQVTPLWPLVETILEPHRRRAGLMFANSEGNAFSEFRSDFAATLPYHCNPHDGRKILTLICGEFVGLPMVALKLLIGHAAERQDVTMKNYILMTPEADKLRVMRPAAQQISDYFSRQIGDADTIARLDVIASQRNEARLVHRRKRNNVYKAGVRATRARIRRVD